MSDSRAQASFEAMFLITIVFIGILFIFSLFFQVSDATVAMQMAKIAVIEKLGSLDRFYAIERIDFLETGDGRGIVLNVSINPRDHGLSSASFAEDQNKIAEKTKYETATINPV